MFARIIVAGLVINTDAEERKAQKARPKSERPRSMTLQYLTDKLKAHEVYAQRRPGESTIDLANGAGSEKWAYRASGNESSIALKPSIVLQTGEEDYNKDAGVDVTDEPIFPPPKRTFTADSTNSFPISPSSQRKFFSDTPFLSAVARQRTLIQTAYLRHSWNRVDCVAIVAYWISFALAETGLEAEKNIYIFRALSVLRAARLLTITSGTTVSSLTVLRRSTKTDKICWSADHSTVPEASGSSFAHGPVLHRLRWRSFQHRRCTELQRLAAQVMCLDR